MLGNHLLGIYEKAFFSDGDWRSLFQKVKALGFDFMELCVDESDERIARLDWPREQRQTVRNAAFEEGVILQSMCLSAHRRYPFGSADPAVRQMAREIMDKAIDLAMDLGIRTIQLAAYDVYYEPSTPDSRKRYEDGLRYAAQRAERRGVMLANEIMDTAFVNSITKHMTYEANIHSPYLRVYPDVGNLSAWNNDVERELAAGIGSIVQVHLKDTLAVSEEFPGKFKCVPFGSGCVDFPLCLRTLDSLGYAGPYLIEMWYQPGSSDVEEVAAAKRWIEAQYALR